MRLNNRTIIFRVKFKSKINSLRKYYYKLFGLNIDDSSCIEKITCDWMDKVYIGSRCLIQNNVLFRINKPFNSDNIIKIGDDVFIGNNCEFNCSSKITIGNGSLIASNTTIVDTGHEIRKDREITLQASTIKEINIGDYVWIGTHCIITQGVTIGRGAVVGAGSVVNKSIPDYEIWGGVPAKFIRVRI